MVLDKFFFLGYQEPFLSQLCVCMAVIGLIAVKLLKRSAPSALWLALGLFSLCWVFNLPSWPLQICIATIIVGGLIIDSFRARGKPPIPGDKRMTWIFRGSMLFLATMMLIFPVTFHHEITLANDKLSDQTVHGQHVVKKDGLKVTVITDGHRPYRFWNFDNGKNEIVIDDHGLWVDSHGNWVKSSELADIVAKWGNVKPKHAIYTIKFVN